MALRNIRKDGDEVLRKKAKEVAVIDEKIQMLLKDMAETMYEAEGVGLAAPQIGILKKIVVIDVGDGLLELINPKIINEEGEQLYVEGCLSIPGVMGEVKRPAKVVAEALNAKGEKIQVEGTGLLAVCLCHEIDHLSGVLFKDKVIRFVDVEEFEGVKQKERQRQRQR